MRAVVVLFAILGLLGGLAAAHATPLRELDAHQRADEMLDLTYLGAGFHDPVRGGIWALEPEVAMPLDGDDRAVQIPLARPRSGDFSPAPWDERRGNASIYDLPEVSSPVQPAGLAQEGAGREAIGPLEGAAAVGANRNGSKVSIRELGRELRQTGLIRGYGGDAARSVSAGEDPLGPDLGLNLVQLVLDAEIDRELTQSLLESTDQIRVLLGITRSQANSLLGTPQRNAQSWSGSRQDFAEPRSIKTTISDEELVRIRAEHEGKTIVSFKDFMSELLVDPRILLFFGLSIAIIVFGSQIVARWSRM